MITFRTTIVLDVELVDQARELKINVSAAARQGIKAAVRKARAESDRQAYLRNPEVVDDGRVDLEPKGG